jgi:hypothetical protein
MTDKVVVIFQNSVNLMACAPGSYSEPCYDVSQFLHIKVEEVTHVQKEEDPRAVPFPVIKNEYEVSFMPMCLLSGTFHTHLDLPVSFLFHTCHKNESAPLLCVDFRVLLIMSHRSISFHILLRVTLPFMFYAVFNDTD